MSTNIDNLYSRTANAETSNLPDKFIRTQVRDAKGGSSAYGPVQITRDLAKGMLKKHGDEFDAELTDYINRFIEQGDLFLEYGNEPDKEGYDPKYDYGGSGHLTSEEDKQMYERMAKKFIEIEYNSAGKDEQAFLKRWRGMEPEEKYVARFNDRASG